MTGNLAKKMKREKASLPFRLASRRNMALA